MEKRVVALLVVLALMAPLISADRTLPSIKQGQCINLVETCGNCTYVNITSVLYPNSSQALGQVGMTKAGFQYNYTFCSTTPLGTYSYSTVNDFNALPQTERITFEVTPNGYTQTTSQGFVAGISLLVIIVLAGFCIFLFAKLVDRPHFWFYGIIALGVGLVFGMYALNLSLVYMRDLAYTTGAFSSYENVFERALQVEKIIAWSVIGVFLVYTYTSWKTRKKQREDDDGWDNNVF